MSTQEKKILAKIKKYIGQSMKRYDFWFYGNTWEGGFELPLETEFRNTYSMQRKILPCSQTVIYETKQNFI